jgi:hypothetical protein
VGWAFSQNGGQVRVLTECMRCHYKVTDIQKKLNIAKDLKVMVSL